MSTQQQQLLLLLHHWQLHVRCQRLLQRQTPRPACVLRPGPEACTAPGSWHELSLVSWEQYWLVLHRVVQAWTLQRSAERPPVLLRSGLHWNWLLPKMTLMHGSPSQVSPGSVGFVGLPGAP